MNGFQMFPSDLVFLDSMFLLPGLLVVPSLSRITVTKGWVSQILKMINDKVCSHCVSKWFTGPP